MGDLTTDQIVVLVRDTAFVLLWATVALVVTRRLREGEWAALAVVGSILLLAASGLNLVQAKFLFVDHDPTLTLTLADWHLLRVPTVVTFVGSVLLAKAVLADRRSAAARAD
jgi:uncharacterized membrane protein